MRALLAVALLTAARGLREDDKMGRVEHWSRLASKTHLAQLSPADVELIFETLGGYPSVTGQVASIMNTHAEDAMSQDPSGLELYLSPLFTRLREPETFKWLLDLHASEHKKCVLANALQEENCALFRKEIGDVFLKLVQLLNHFHLNRGVVDFDDAFMEVVVSHTKDIVEMMKRVEDNISDSQPPSRADMVLEMLTAATKRAISSSYGSLMGVNHRVSEGEGLTTADVDLLFDRLENVPVLRMKASSVIYSHQSNVLKAGGGSPLDLLESGIFANDPLFSRLRERETFNWLLDIAADEKSRCVGSKIDPGSRDDCVGFLWNLAQLFEVVAGTSFTAITHLERIVETPEETREAVELSSLVRSRGDEILALAQFMYDTINEDDIDEEGPKYKETVAIQMENLRTIFSLHGSDLVDDDATVSKGPHLDRITIIAMKAAAAAVVLASLYVWKRRASATGRTRRGREPADTGAAPIPVWATVLRVMACGSLIYDLVFNQFGYDGKGSMLYVVLTFGSMLFCSWTGLRTIIDWATSGSGIWGRIGADALVLVNLMQSFRQSRVDYDLNGFTALLIHSCGAFGACVLFYRAFCCLTSGPDAERAARELLDAEAEREATNRARAPQRGARPGRGRPAERTPGAPTLVGLRNFRRRRGRGGSCGAGGAAP